MGALKRRPALKRVSLLPEPVEEVVLPSDYEKVVARHLKRTSRDSRDERRLSRSSFYRDQALRDLGNPTRPPTQEEEVPERAETPYDIREAIARGAARDISEISPAEERGARAAREYSGGKLIRV